MRLLSDSILILTSKINLDSTKKIERATLSLNIATRDGGQCIAIAYAA
jgi:hypothetical protein